MPRNPQVELPSDGPRPESRARSARPWSRSVGRPPPAKGPSMRTGSYRPARLAVALFALSMTVGCARADRLPETAPGVLFAPRTDIVVVPALRRPPVHVHSPPPRVRVVFVGSPGAFDGGPREPRDSVRDRPPPRGHRHEHARPKPVPPERRRASSDRPREKRPEASAVGPRAPQTKAVRALRGRAPTQRRAVDAPDARSGRPSSLFAKTTTRPAKTVPKKGKPKPRKPPR